MFDLDNSGLIKYKEQVTDSNLNFQLNLNIIIYLLKKK